MTSARPRKRSPVLWAIVTAGALLAGCQEGEKVFVTTADVDLRSGQEDDSSVVARLPEGTPVVPAGQVGSHCNSCWKVSTPQGTGWVYTRYLTTREAGEP